MSNHRVYIAASTQAHNEGVANYGTEQDNMMHLADRVKYWLETQNGQFTVFRNRPNWTLSQTVNDCNSLACAIFIDNHTNAGGDNQIQNTVNKGGGLEGTEVMYNHNTGITGKSYELARKLYGRIAPMSPGKDRGVLPDDTYVGSLFVIQRTEPPAALIEHFFHVNSIEVKDFLAYIDKYAKAEAMGICDYFGVKWIEPYTAKPNTVGQLVADMIQDGIVGDKDYWTDMLSGKKITLTLKDIEYLQIAFRNATAKIK